MASAVVGQLWGGAVRDWREQLCGLEGAGSTGQQDVAWGGGWEWGREAGLGDTASYIVGQISKEDKDMNSM